MNFVGCTKVQTKSWNDAQTSENIEFLPKNAFILMECAGRLSPTVRRKAVKMYIFNGSMRQSNLFASVHSKNTLLGLPKFSPEPQFEPQTSGLNLRFWFGLVLVHRSTSWSSLWFLTKCSMENQFWTGSNHEPHSGELEYWFWLWGLKRESSVANIEEQWDVKIRWELILKQYCA